MDSVIALTLALFVNSAILIVSAANFYYSPPSSPQHQQIDDLFSAHNLLVSALGPTAGFFYALGLLFAGHGRTGYHAGLPMVVAIVAGNQGLNGILVGSQVSSCPLPLSRLCGLLHLEGLCVPSSMSSTRTKTKMSEHRPLDAHEEADLAMQRMPDLLPLSVVISSDFQDSELPPLPSTGTASLPPRRRASSVSRPRAADETRNAIRSAAAPLDALRRQAMGMRMGRGRERRESHLLTLRILGG
ncbi:hypothetical protein BC937DRAFT_87361 [Endogone sp. FLAS-F59071]|nr:hypothetical protein BC937DRAFT_87361 [Endogone sp. FLAS-F59071]|eukprot:RUS19513.1 hypothetical protein BC937DRAFT_87361 [Endogone sp. FLAS-F59071]